MRQRKCCKHDAPSDFGRKTKENLTTRQTFRPVEVLSLRLERSRHRAKRLDKKILGL